MPRYDVHISPVPEDRVRGYKVFEFGYAAPLKVRGLQALINRWVKTLITPKGSDLTDTAYGTDFSNMIGANMSAAEGLTEDLVNLAVLDASEQVRVQDTINLANAQERLKSAEVIQYIPQPSGFQVWVLIKNEAGESAATAVGNLKL